MKFSALNLLIFLGFLLLDCSPLAQQNRTSAQKMPFHLHEIISDCPFYFEQVQLCAQLGRTEKSYPVGKELSFHLAFWKKTDFFTGPYTTSQLTPHLKLWMRMPQGDHGSLPVIVNLIADGQYEVSQVSFSMPPEIPEEYWELQISLQNSQGTTVDHATAILWSYSASNH